MSVDNLGEGEYIIKVSADGAITNIEKFTRSIEKSEQRIDVSNKRIVRSFIGTAAGVVGLVFAFSNLEKIQIRIDQSANKVEKAQRTVNKIVADGRKNSNDYRIALKDLEIQQERHKQATQDMTQAQVGFGFQLVGVGAQLIQTIPLFAKIAAGHGVAALATNTHTAAVTAHTVATRANTLASLFNPWTAAATIAAAAAAIALLATNTFGLRDAVFGHTTALEKNTIASQANSRATTAYNQALTTQTTVAKESLNTVQRLYTGMLGVKTATEEATDATESFYMMNRGGKWVVNEAVDSYERMKSAISDYTQKLKEGRDATELWNLSLREFNRTMDTNFTRFEYLKFKKELGGLPQADSKKKDKSISETRKEIENLFTDIDKARFKLNDAIYRQWQQRDRARLERERFLDITYGQRGQNISEMLQRSTIIAGRRFGVETIGSTAFLIQLAKQAATQRAVNIARAGLVGPLRGMSQAYNNMVLGMFKLQTSGVGPGTPMHIQRQIAEEQAQRLSKEGLISKMWQQIIRAGETSGNRGLANPFLSFTRGEMTRMRELGLKNPFGDIIQAMREGVITRYMIRGMSPEGARGLITSIRTERAEALAAQEMDVRNIREHNRRMEAMSTGVVN